MTGELGAMSSVASVSNRFSSEVSGVLPSLILMELNVLGIDPETEEITTIAKARKAIDEKEAQIADQRGVKQALSNQISLDYTKIKDIEDTYIPYHLQSADN